MNPFVLRWLLRNLLSARYPLCAKHSPVAFDFRRRTEHLCIIVGELYCWPPFNVGHFADQADRIKFAAASRIAVPEIVRQKSSPTSAESNAPARDPLLSILEVCDVEFL